MLKEILTTSGHEVDTTFNGAAAVVLDLQMPRLGGCTRRRRPRT